MLRYFTALCLLLCNFHIKAQDSLPKWKPVFHFDNRLSSLRHTSVILIGAKFGYQYKNHFRIGIGTSFIVKPVEFQFIDRRTSKVSTNKVDFWYFSVYGDWILYKKHGIEIYVTEQIGFGKPRYTRSFEGNEVLMETNVNLYINELSTQISYKINSSIGVGLGIGYRSLFNKRFLLTDTFEAPIYMGKIILYPDWVIKKIFKKKAPDSFF